jgi:hypothetical protein
VADRREIAVGSLDREHLRAYRVPRPWRATRRTWRSGPGKGGVVTGSGRLE